MCDESVDPEGKLISDLEKHYEIESRRSELIESRAMNLLTLDGVISGLLIVFLTSMLGDSEAVRLVLAHACSPGLTLIFGSAFLFYAISALAAAIVQFLPMWIPAPFGTWDEVDELKHGEFRNASLQLHRKRVAIALRLGIDNYVRQNKWKYIALLVSYAALLVGIVLASTFGALLFSILISKY